MKVNPIYRVGEYPYWPNKIKIGAGSRKDIVNDVRSYGGTKIMFITDKNIISLRETQALINLLNSECGEVYIYDDVEENPSNICVDKAVAYMHQVKPEVLIYYGGGSVIDLGKAANLIYTHRGKINEYEDLAGGISKIKNILVPAIAIPTTAGSGSEVSSVSVITDSKRKVKMGILSPYIVPQVSVLDAEVTVDMPPDLTAYTGMDALTHCIEAYVSNICFEPGRGIAYQGIKLIKKYLYKAVIDGGDLVARENMLVASSCGAMAFNNNYLGTVHACAHQLSSVVGIPHGLANAVMLLPVMRWNLESNIQGYAEVAQALGTNIYNKPIEEVAKSALSEVEELASLINIPQHLSDLGVTEHIINELTNKAYNDHNNLSNPRADGVLPNPVSKESIRKLFLAAL
ncbi:MAG: iron-containing alcohol dehydrogenase [Lachnoclostridium sp.]|nr:iron-containing alcohol dehydrogenase [Lachnospira sp.]MCM1248918.1 iron-containing alcohol dehydrogenase [Lachnoclostridium sp.]MCM1535226.1 iron-containing alcohol dehydrogenase [Clostridium sp.]